MQTETHEDGGKNPKWNQKFAKLEVADIDEDIFFNLYDAGIVVDSPIGLCPVTISSLVLNAEKEEQTDWFSIFLENERVGMLCLKSSFKPHGQLEIEKPEDTVEK